MTPRPLTNQQRVHVAYLAEGLSYAEIGKKVHRSTGTVNSTLTEARKRYGVGNSVSLVMMAIRRGEIELPEAAGGPVWIGEKRIKAQESERGGRNGARL